MLYLLIFVLHCEFLLFHLLKLVTEVEFGGLLLQFGEFVLVFGDFAQRWFDTECAGKYKNSKKKQPLEFQSVINHHK
jgi:hypothetical protein